MCIRRSVFCTLELWNRCALLAVQVERSPCFLSKDVLHNYVGFLPSLSFLTCLKFVGHLECAYRSRISANCQDYLTAPCQLSGKQNVKFPSRWNCLQNTVACKNCSLIWKSLVSFRRKINLLMVQEGVVFFIAYMPLNICNVGIFGTCCSESLFVLACLLLYLLLCDNLSFDFRLFLYLHM